MKDNEQAKNPDNPASTTLTTGEVARIFNVSTSTIRRWSDQGILKVHGTGPRGERRFRREEVAVVYLDRAIQKYLKGK